MNSLSHGRLAFLHECLGQSRDSTGISELPQIRLILPYKISCIEGSSDIPLTSLGAESNWTSRDLSVWVIITGPEVSPAHTPGLTLTTGGRRRSAQPWHRTCETGQPEQQR